MSDSEHVNLTIGGQDFHLRVEPHERERLLQAARYVEEKMAYYHKTGGAVSTPRQAVLASLDLAHELLREREGVGEESTQRMKATRRVENLVDQLDEALSGHNIEEDSSRG